MTTTTALRRGNTQAVLDVLLGGGAHDGVALMATTGLSRPTVHGVCDVLIARGLAVELAPVGGGGPGRRPRVYAARPEAAHVVGVDMGEATVRAAVADLRGDVVGEASAVLSDPRMAAQRRLVLVRDTVARALATARVEPASVQSAALGVPAPVTADGHAVAVDSYLPGLAAVDLHKALRPLLDTAVIVENDADLAVLGERWQGAAAGCADAVLLLAGERLGTGICVGGRLLRGSSGGAGEMGFLHMVSGVGDTDGIGRLLRGATGVAATDAFAAARRGDPAALAALAVVSSRVGRVLAILATLLDPQVVVLGGAVAEAGPILMEPLRRAYAAALQERPLRATPLLVASRLAERGTLVGAIRVALDDLVPRLLDLH
ncbi:MAG: ROK family protein [Pseudonocardiales bacterium]|nr:ROK family protein [Pseudonocardiales bacterium]